ncbi:sigma 54-interacting transcriptional regulator [Desulforegula conservatrix]|uniref:sigma 54-interacting transcriptional regulator n=1 Tax=Desulforegula conservatrix TaxID=153026 RepID=UPI000404C0A9|nr:sigma 54-interacting transcriptional regulator [Desulforegula conservatrix]
MAKKHRLTDSERKYFEMIWTAGMTNPFSDERKKIDFAIAGAFPDVSHQEMIARLVGELAERLDKLEKEGRGHIRSYEGEDRRLLHTAFLFELFYRFRKRIDSMIQDQIKAGNKPVKVSFAAEAMELMAKRGIERGNLFEMAFQLRRAYFFIDRALVGRSPSMKLLRKSLWNNVFTHKLHLYDKYLWNRMEDFSTILLGETGTGKGTAAMAIGRSGFIPFDAENARFVNSFTDTFTSLNLSQFPETIIESELFGHKKGSFTGAVEDYKGFLARCSPYGAIFLDEIGDVSAHVQIKLLNVLQEREFYPVGSHESIRFHGRVIAATNRSLEKLRESGFREDFYYRLCSDQITMPALRERIRENPSELDDLLSHTINRLVGSPSPELFEMSKNVIMDRLGPNYSWPGNVRELEQCVRRIILTSSYEGHKPSGGPESTVSILKRGVEEGTLTATDLLSGYCAGLYEVSRTYGDVARKTGLDWRTVKKYVDDWNTAKNR